MRGEQGLFDLPGDETPGGEPSPGGRPAGRSLVVETDGGSRGNPGPAGYGAVVRDADSGEVLAERAGYLGVVSNNVAEYTGLLEGLRAAAAIDPAARVEVRADSRLVVEQMSGRWKIKHADMRRLAAEAGTVLPAGAVTYTWVPRAENKAADALANRAMDTRAGHDRDYWAAGDRDAAAAPSAEEPDDAAPSAPEPVPIAPGRRPSGAALVRGEGEPTTVVLVRHGVTALTEAGIYSGSDTPGPVLSPLGEQQAARAAALVARIGVDLWPDLPRPTALVASPVVRAVQTARALGQPLGLTAEEDDAFAEVRFGEWDGLTMAQIEERFPGALGRWAAEPGAGPAGGESLAALAERVGAGLRRLASAHAGRTVVVASHTVVNRAAVGLVGRLPQETWPAVRIPPASVTIVRLWPGAGDDLGPGELTVVGCPSEVVGG